MLETRRVFVLAMAGAAGFLAAEQSRLFAQYPPTPPPPPQPAETPNPAEMHSDPRATAAENGRACSKTRRNSAKGSSVFTN